MCCLLWRPSTKGSDHFCSAASLSAHRATCHNSTTAHRHSATDNPSPPRARCKGPRPRARTRLCWRGPDRPSHGTSTTTRRAPWRDRRPDAPIDSRAGHARKPCNRISRRKPDERLSRRAAHASSWRMDDRVHRCAQVRTARQPDPPLPLPPSNPFIAQSALLAAPLSPAWLPATVLALAAALIDGKLAVRL